LLKLGDERVVWRVYATGAARLRPVLIGVCALTAAGAAAAQEDERWDDWTGQRLWAQLSPSATPNDPFSTLPASKARINDISRGVRFHTVTAGETLFSVAQKYGYTIDDLAAVNRIGVGRTLSIGDILYLPQTPPSGEPAGPSAAPLRRPDRPRPAPAPAGGHVIAPQDTLFSISRRYGVSVADLAAANAMSASDTLTIGDNLKIPGADPAPAPAPAAAPSPAPAARVDAGRTAPAARAAAAAQTAQTAPPVEAGQAPGSEPDISGLMRFQYIPDEPAAGEATVSSESSDRVDVSLAARVRYAYGYDASQIQLADIDLEPAFEVDLGADWSFFVKGRFRADARDAIEPGRPNQTARSSISSRALIGDRAEAELREAYLQGTLLDIDWTIGKQQIVWGESDGFQVLDVVNPQSFREFVLPAFDESRIPLWSARAEKVIGATTLEGVVVFDNTYDEFPDPGAAFELTSPRFVPSAEQAVTAVAEALAAAAPPDAPPQAPPALVIADPSRTGAADQADFGGRIKTFLGGFDLSLLYLRHTEDIPTADLALVDGALLVTPVYDRVNLIGGTFANSFGSFTVRGEVGYTTDRRLLREVDPAEVDPAVLANGQSFGAHAERDVVSYVLGVDYFGVSDTVFSLQFFHDVILNAPDGLTRPDNDYLMTGYVRRKAMNQKLLLEIEGLVNLVDEDALIRPLIQYEYSDTVSYFLAGDIFLGPEEGVFGQFEPASRVSLGALFNF